MTEPELLELGDERRRRPPRRLRVVLLALGLVLAVAGFLVDRSVRAREERAVAACAQEATTAVDLAGRPVHAAYEYIRPVLANGPGRARSADLYLLVAEAAPAGVDPDVAAAARRCGAITVLPWHDAVRQRRERCLAVLSRQRSGLAAIARDGKAVLAWMDAPRRC